MSRHWKPKKHKKQMKLSFYFFILISLLMPFLTYILFPEGDREVSVGVMLVYMFIGAFALAIEKGYWLWLIIEFEAALWRFMFSFASLNGNYSMENIMWLGERFLVFFSYVLLFSAFFGFVGRFCIWFVKGGDDNHGD